MGEFQPAPLSLAPPEQMPRFLPATYRTLLIVSVLVVVAFLIFELFQDLRSANESNALVEHTYNVLLQSDRLATGLRDAEIGQLRYVISGAEPRLGVYETAIRDVPQALAQLRRLTADNAQQQERLKELDQLIKLRLDVFAKRIQARREQGQSSAFALINTDAGLIAGRRTRALLNALIAEEQTLLKQRKSTASRQARSTLEFLLVGSVVLLGLLICINYILERDVVLRRRAEVEVRSSEILFRGMFDNASVGIALLSASGHFQLVNSRFCEITGYTRQQLLDQAFHSIAFPDDLPASDLITHLAEPEAVIYSDKKRCVRGDGSTTWVKLTASALPAAEGAPKRFLSIIEDVNAQLQAEEALRAANVSLLRSNESLQEFAYVASHDLQEPLRTISMFSQLLMREQTKKLDERGEKFLNIICDSASRMSQLIEALLSYSRANSDDEQAFQQVNLEDLLKDTLEALRARIEQEKAIIDSDPLPVVYGDPVRLHQVFQNLIGNALKYRRPDTAPHIQVRCQRSQAEWVIRVCDNGLGFAPRFAERIFGIFKRLHGNEIAGTGVGLAVVKTVVHRHGGRVWAESAGDNLGATFNFTIPIAR